MTSTADALVVYVDDDAANRVVFEQAFQRRFRLLTCASGDEALLVLEQRPVAVMLTDQRMPGISGNELLRLTRERSPDTVCIVVTAHDDLEPILEAVNNQLAVRYIVKPWLLREMESTIAWGGEVYRLAREKSDLEMKLLQGERLTTLGSIAAGVLHDFKQPLAILRSNLEVVRDYAALIAPRVQLLLEAVEVADQLFLRQLAADVPDAISDALTAAEQLAGIADSGLRFLAPPESRLRERGKGAPVEEGGDPGLAARYAVTLCRPKVLVHGGALRLRLEGEALPPTSLSTTALTQVMVNLLVNAAQALVPGRRHSLVELRVEAEHEGLRLTVRDNGSGMGPGVLARAREPFFTTKPNGEGSGLGLYNTQRLVSEAGGRMLLESAENEGTTVMVWVPRVT